MTALIDDGALINRAIRRYLNDRDDFIAPDQPSPSCCEIVRRRGLDYVVLRNNYRTLAVFEVRGKTHRLYELYYEDWPKRV